MAHFPQAGCRDTGFLRWNGLTISTLMPNEDGRKLLSQVLYAPGFLSIVLERDRARQLGYSGTAQRLDSPVL